MLLLFACFLHYKTISEKISRTSTSLGEISEGPCCRSPQCDSIRLSNVVRLYLRHRTSSLFFSWMLHDPTSSLSGRSPFCQLRKDKRCRCNIGYEIPIESNGVKTQKDTNQTTLQPSRECKGVGSRWPVPQTIN